MHSTTRETAMFAIPNDSDVCSAIPWFRTSQGESPSSDSRIRTIANANTSSPNTRLTERAA